MNFLKKAQDFAAKAGNKKTQQQQPPQDYQGQGQSSSHQQQPPQNQGQKEDYGDKLFSAAAKKAGFNLSRDTSEKVTDAARGFIEKSTGKRIPDKFSN
ncbi:hypothetical protein PT974_03833 [Cladobotryum mycophilum]|uniref:SMP domain-containing protein n=1 Tax=Cladobotryum mycophilum TaxID=491253 RepID=A0ABR0STE1_9HYPO